MNFSLVIPDEWIRASAVLKDMCSNLARSESSVIKQISAFVVPVVLGGVFGKFAFVGIEPPALEPIMRSTLQFLAIVTGFMVTLMLFTGKAENTKILTSDDLRKYSKQVRFILFFQTMTLLNHLVTAVLILVWMSVASHPSWEIWLPYLTISIFAMLFNSLLRTFLLPMQIYELTSFGLESLIKERTKDETDAINKKFD